MKLESVPSKTRVILLLVVQAMLVLSIAGKYLYERHTCPRVWVPAAQFDPNMPLRGRYLALQLAVDACSLPHDRSHYTPPYQIPDMLPNPDNQGSWHWVIKTAVRDGKLVPVLAEADGRPQETYEISLQGSARCDRATIDGSVVFYIPDTAKTPFPLKRGQELWVEVTVPPAGPPRPIHLALSQNGGWTPLGFN